MFGLIRKSKYIALALHCLKEQKRAQDAECQVNQLLADNDMLTRLVMHYKHKADRLEYTLHHPRKSDGRFIRTIPIINMEALNG